MIAQAALLTVFVLGGNRTLASSLGQPPDRPDSRSTRNLSEALYDVLVTADITAVGPVREFLLETLAAANYPVRDTNVVYRSDEEAEIVATLVSLSIEPDELDAVVANLTGLPGVRHVTWNVRALE